MSLAKSTRKISFQELELIDAVELTVSNLDIKVHPDILENRVRSRIVDAQKRKKTLPSSWPMPRDIYLRWAIVQKGWGTLAQLHGITPRTHQEAVRDSAAITSCTGDITFPGDQKKLLAQVREFERKNQDLETRLAEFGKYKAEAQAMEKYKKERYEKMSKAGRAMRRQ